MVSITKYYYQIDKEMLKKMLEEKGLSEDDLCHLLKIPFKDFIFFTFGNRHSLTLLEKIAKTLNVDKFDITYGSIKMEKIMFKNKALKKEYLKQEMKRPTTRVSPFVKFD